MFPYSSLIPDKTSGTSAHALAIMCQCGDLGDFAICQVKQLVLLGLNPLFSASFLLLKKISPTWLAMLEAISPFERMITSLLYHFGTTWHAHLCKTSVWASHQTHSSRESLDGSDSCCLAGGLGEVSAKTTT